jgi:hypothetical protein
MEQVKTHPETRLQILAKARDRAVKSWQRDCNTRGMDHRLTSQSQEVITRIDFLIKVETKMAEAERQGFSVDQAAYWAASSGSGGL